MKRAEWGLLCWLVLSLVFLNIKFPSGSSDHVGNSGSDKGPNGSSEDGDNSGVVKDPNGSSEHGDNSGVVKDPNGSSEHGANSWEGKDPKENSEHGDNSGEGKGPNGSSERDDNSGEGKGPNGSSERGDNSGEGKGPKKSSECGDDSGVSKRTKDGLDCGNTPGLCNGSKDCSNRSDNPGSRKGSNRCTMFKKKKSGVSATRDCMEDVNSILKNGNGSDSIEAIESLEKFLKETEVNETTSVSVQRMVAVLHKPKGPFTGLQIYANDNEAMSGKAVTNSKVRVRLPRELNVGPDNTIVFCMLTWPEINETLWGASGVLYENRLVGLSVRGKSIFGLQEHVNITVNLTGHGEEEPNCSFFNFSTKTFSSYGCTTIWKPDQSQVTCSCDHLTYFGVLMLPSPPPSPTDQMILSYITLIGCSLSLVSLIITLLLFIRNRKARTDTSMKVHINLAIALILLNVHFLPNQMVAATSSDGLCLYIALSLHYSLLATFTWMALEGFHLYLLLVKVFNIYIRKYLLKLSLVGWGIPAIIVSLVIIIDRNYYGRVPLNSNYNSTEICYIVDTTVKTVTTVGVFGLVFLFNVTMLGVTVRCILVLRKAKEFGQNDRTRAKRDICTLMGVTTLLGITWGLVFFSFGYLNTAGTYLFCILNSLQGFFIFLWFVMSLGKNGNPPIKMSSETRSTKS